MAEAVSVALRRTYVEMCGRVLHHNFNKALLAAGCSSPRLCGGTVDSPMRLFLGDRNTAEVDGRAIPIADIAVAAALDWFRKNLRFVDADRQVRTESLMSPGSVKLSDLFARSDCGANDTSVGVGYAPLTETERLTLAAERRLNSLDWKSSYPELGEDVKVMAVRRDLSISMTVAAAIVERFVPNAATYFARKSEIVGRLQNELSRVLHECDDFEVALNVLDDPARGVGGMHLTVTGTSAEGADSGQVARGNRVNDPISPHRAMSLEAVAGKNPVSHVGKIYNVLVLETAQKIVDRFGGADFQYFVGRRDSRRFAHVGRRERLENRLARVDGQRSVFIGGKLSAAADERLARHPAHGRQHPLVANSASLQLVFDHLPTQLVERRMRYHAHYPEKLKIAQT